MATEELGFQNDYGVKSPQGMLIQVNTQTVSKSIEISAIVVSKLKGGSKFAMNAAECLATRRSNHPDYARFRPEFGVPKDIRKSGRSFPHKDEGGFSPVQPSMETLCLKRILVIVAIRHGHLLLLTSLTQDATSAHGETHAVDLIYHFQARTETGPEALSWMLPCLPALPART